MRISPSIFEIPLITNLNFSLQESKGGGIASEKDELDNLIEDFNSRYTNNSSFKTRSSLRA